MADQASKVDQRIDRVIEKNLHISHPQWERTAADRALDKLVERRHEGEVKMKAQDAIKLLQVLNPELDVTLVFGAVTLNYGAPIAPAPFNPAPCYPYPLTGTPSWSSSWGVCGDGNVAIKS